MQDQMQWTLGQTQSNGNISPFNDKKIHKRVYSSEHLQIGIVISPTSPELKYVVLAAPWFYCGLVHNTETSLPMLSIKHNSMHIKLILQHWFCQAVNVAFP